MKIFITRMIPEEGIEKLKEAGYNVSVSEKDGVLTAQELKAALKILGLGLAAYNKKRP